MKHRFHLPALTAALTSGIAYTVCSAFVAFNRLQALNLAADLFHMRSLELFEPYIQITSSNYISGLIQSMIYSYLYVAVAVSIYYKLKERKK